MEVYILDSLLRREEVVDRFDSLIWTERWADIGDFQLVLQSTAATRGLFQTGKRLAITESVRVMTVETVEDTTTDDDRKMLKVTGRSLEAVLEDRVALGTTSGYQPTPTWWIPGHTPGDVVRFMFNSICVLGDVHPNDVLPFIVMDQTLFPVDSILEPSEEIDWEQKPTSLFEAIQNLCKIYDLGFRLYRNGDTSQLFFNVYSGSDRTNPNAGLTPVIFSENLDTVQGTTELTTIEKSKNVAYVFTTINEQLTNPDGSPMVDVDGNPVKGDVLHYAIVYPVDVDPSIEGFERRIMFVEAQVDPVTNPDIEAALERKGLDELAKVRAFTAFDGEITQYSQYKYGFDYYLGDLVVMQNSDGFANNMRVTEQIFTSDANGDRSYPTLAVNLFINPGSWASWGFQVWEDLGSDTWADQP